MSEFTKTPTPTDIESAMDAISAYLGSTDNPSHLLIGAKCRGLIAGYAARWANAPYQLDTIEGIVVSDLWNPETGRKSRSFSVAGKIDLTAFHDGRRVIFDHKTTSEDISDPNSPYWRQLVVEGQPSHYSLLEWLNGRKVDDVVWDVVRKPGISPRNVAKADQKGIFQSKRYFERDLSEASLLELQNTGRESLEMYEARLAFDCTVERPQWYFQRRSVPRLDADIHEYATELWEHSQEILHARRTKRFARNSGACLMYKRPCAFLGICSGHDNPDSDNWQKKENVHAELPGLEGDGRDVLTNSRIRCFQTCRRKHFYQYELGIEHRDEEEAEALYFGSCWHAALEAWFLAQKESNDYDSDGAPVNEVGITN